MIPKLYLADDICKYFICSECNDHTNPLLQDWKYCPLCGKKIKGKEFKTAWKYPRRKDKKLQKQLLKQT